MHENQSFLRIDGIEFTLTEIAISIHSVDITGFDEFCQ